MAGSDEDRGFSFDLGPTPTPAPARRRLGTEREPELDHFDLDLGDLGLSPLATSPPPPAASPVPPAAQLPSEPRLFTRNAPLLADEPGDGQSEGAAARVEAKRDPAIKRVLFPVSAPSRTAGPQAQPAPRVPSRPVSGRTQFSDSISTRPSSAFHDELDLPEDLPDPWSAEQPDTLSEETPGLGALWAMARTSFSQRRAEAVVWSRQGADAGRRVAAQFRSALREKRQAAAVARMAAAATSLPTESTSPAAPLRPSTTSGSASAPATFSAPHAPGVPFVTSRRGLAWRPVARRAAAPLATLALACTVYLGGSHLLGTVELPALSHDSAPDLGTLPEPVPATSGATADPLAPEGSRSAAAPDKRKRAASAPKGPQPPQIEQLPLPTGVDFPGKGLIEVVTAEDELIYVNGVFLGRGPLRRVPVTPGEHAVSIRNGSEERAGTLTVEAGRCARVSFVRLP